MTNIVNFRAQNVLSANHINDSDKQLGKLHQQVIIPVNSSNDKLIKENSHQTSNKNTLFAGAAILAVAVLAGFALLKNKKSSKIIPDGTPDYKVIFEKIKDLEKTDFTKAFYDELVKAKGYEGILPELEIKKLLEVKNYIKNIGGFDLKKVKMELDKDSINAATKEEIIDWLSHEFKHVDQFFDIFRTEGLGIESYAKAVSDVYIDAVKNHKQIMLPKLIEDMKKYSVMTDIEKSAFEKSVFRSNLNLYEKRYKNLVMRKEPIKADTERGLKAKEYLEAYRNYPPPRERQFSQDDSQYTENLLEVEARQAGEEVVSIYRNLMAGKSN